ncbi:MAG TPA: hypothetical protein VGC15_07210 [Acetobacteraceae bacterium]
MSTQTAFPDVGRKLVRARDDQMAQVVALVDALVQRGQADALIAPLRPRLALLAPSRLMTVTRLMFRPLDPVIVPGSQWRPGMPALPRTALGCLGAAVVPRLGAAGMTIQAMLAGLPPGAPADTARDAAARAGAMLWPGAAAVLDNLLTPPDWTDSTGLPPSCFGPVRAAAAAVLHQAARLARLYAGADSGETDIAAGISAILMDAQSRPGGLATVLAMLLAYGPSAALLAGFIPGGPANGASPGLAALPAGALDSAVEQALDRAGALVETVLPGVALAAAAGHARDVAALVAALEQPGSRPSLRVQAGRTRLAADQACRSRMAQAVQQDLMPRLLNASNDDPLDDAEVGCLESVARDLRRLGRIGRRLGQPAAYDTLMIQIAKEVGRLSAPGLTRMDRLRLAELLVGAQAALRLVPEENRT